MTKRTFGFILTLAIISVGAFTSALVLAYPNPNSTETASGRQTDTRALDKRAIAVNTPSSQPEQSNITQQVDANQQAALGGNTSTAQPSVVAPQQQAPTATPTPVTQTPVPVQTQLNTPTPPKQDQSLLGNVGNTLNQLLGPLLN